MAIASDQNADKPKIQPEFTVIAFFRFLSLSSVQCSKTPTRVIEYHQMINQVQASSTIHVNRTC